MSKVRIIFSCFLLVILASIIINSIYIRANRPPNHEFFKANPEAFRFEFFYTRQSFYNTVNSILSEGMSKKNVDDILVKLAGAQVEEYSEKDISYYAYTKETKSADRMCPLIYRADQRIAGFKPLWLIIVRYDEKQRLTKFIQPHTDKSYLVNTAFKCYTKF